MSKGLSEVQSADPGAHHFPQEHGLDAIFFGRGERCQWVGGWGSGHQFFSFFSFLFLHFQVAKWDSRCLSSCF